MTRNYPGQKGFPGRGKDFRDDAFVRNTMGVIRNYKHPHCLRITYVHVILIIGVSNPEQ